MINKNQEAFWNPSKYENKTVSNYLKCLLIIYAPYKWFVLVRFWMDLNLRILTQLALYNYQTAYSSQSIWLNVIIQRSYHHKTAISKALTWRDQLNFVVFSIYFLFKLFHWFHQRSHWSHQIALVEKFLFPFGLIKLK